MADCPDKLLHSIWPTVNRRRSNLIHQEVYALDAMDDHERAELAALQRYAEWYLETFFPRPEPPEIGGLSDG